LPIVNQIGRAFVIGVEPGFEPRRDLLIDAEIKNVGSFRLDRVVERDLRLLGRAIIGGDVDRRGERKLRGREITGVAAVEGRGGRGLPREA
jgi:hypothetical protein